MRPPYEGVGAKLNRASSTRATPPSDGVVFHHADDKFHIAKMNAFRRRDGDLWCPGKDPSPNKEVRPSRLGRMFSTQPSILDWKWRSSADLGTKGHTSRVRRREILV